MVFFAVALGSSFAGVAAKPAVASVSPAPEITAGPAVSIVSSERSGAESVYRLRVTEQGRGAVVIVPSGAGLASLEVNGVERARSGYNYPVGAAPLGHGMATFPLANLRATDRVVIRVWGSRAPLRIVDDPRMMDGVHALGFLSGAYYAVLAIVVFFVIVSICIARDSTMAWYLGYTLSLMLIELTRDDALPIHQGANLVVLLAGIALSTVAVIGFYVSYLRLRTEAPRLLYVLGFWGIAPWIVTAIYVMVMHSPLTGEVLVPAMSVVLTSCIVIAEIRRRQGYQPALYIAIGFLGLSVAFVSDIVRSAMNAPSPFLDRWQIELGSTFDVLAFAVAVTVRSRYAARDRAKIKRDFDLASFDAGHDELTGLLNRRGLEQRFASLEAFASTVLFIDLDGFKAINDRGGHAAGDDALKITSRILRNAVRADDVVARVGGDEFVVVLTGYRGQELLAAVIERISEAVAGVRPLGADDPTRFGVSIGSAEAEPGQPLAAAIAAADASAYRIKIEHHAHARKSRQRRFRLGSRSSRV